MPTSNKSNNLAAPLTKNGKIDHRYNVPQKVKNDGSRDMRTKLVKTSKK